MTEDERETRQMTDEVCRRLLARGDELSGEAALVICSLVDVLARSIAQSEGLDARLKVATGLLAESMARTPATTRRQPSRGTRH